jgi:hypothetical protein
MNPIRMRGLLVAVLLLGVSHAWASCNGYDTAKWSATSEQEARSCLTNLNNQFSISKCDQPICKDVAEWRNKPQTERVTAAPKLLEKVRLDFQPAVTAFPTAKPLDDAMSAFVQQLKSATPEILRDPARDPFINAASRAWAYDAVAGLIGQGEGGTTTPVEIHLGDVLAQACAPDVAQTHCSEAVAAAGSTVLHALLYQTAVTSFQKEDREAFLAYVETTDQRWANYFDSSRSQFPWELLVNSWRFDSELKHRRDNPNDAEGPGLSGPPGDQWILLHPSVGLRYASGADRKLDQVIVLEALGYYRWDWRGADVKSPLGGSLIATWRGSGTEQRKGYGFMAHLPKNYSIGLIQEHGNGQRHIALVISADLEKLFQDPAAQKNALLGILGR